MSDSSVNGDLLAPARPSSSPNSKRKASDAGLPTTGTRIHKSVKRRASKACQSCRARKVRCNVVEQSPCTNCRLDEVECIVSESKRKKKWTKGDEEGNAAGDCSPPAPASIPQNLSFHDSPGHLPHSLYQDLNPQSFDSARRQSLARSISIPQDPTDSISLSGLDPISLFGLEARTSSPHQQLPGFIRTFPSTFGPDDLSYLARKGALTIPPPALRAALLRCFVENIHPYMPLLDVHELIHTVDTNDSTSAVSLLLFQAIMFAGVASVDMAYLQTAGYTNRRAARREFFQKTRLLYDFDYESDRISLIQSLLLMTFWYETPDDQKDSHHWMGIAVSLSHTIGLHRNPERSNMDPKQRRLWKRIWWATYMRDRMIALGMRRPTRIKNEDFDVPMLTVDDFDFNVLTSQSSCIPPSCKIMQDTTMQRDLAIMCIEKAKLCICISHVLSTQYSVLHNNHGVQSHEGTTRTTMMLVARKDDPENCSVKACDEELKQWKASIAPEAKYKPSSLFDLTAGKGTIALHRSLLHMVYLATLSALHRPQVLPSTAAPSRKMASEVLDTSRRTVRFAANRLTAVAQNLNELDLIRCLPTSGITVLLPAIIIHLLDIKAPDETTRRASLQGFCQCMQILNKLRDIYAAADFSTAFLEAAIRKAEITLPPPKMGPPPRPTHVANISHVMKAARLGHANVSRLTPPPELAAATTNDTKSRQQQTEQMEPQVSENDLAQHLNNFLASTPPGSEHTTDSQIDDTTAAAFNIPALDADFDTLINLDAAGESFTFDDGTFPTMPAFDSTDGGFMDMDWMRHMNCNDDISFGI
ncbi:hypothetical protein M436DRAFT_82937 [Aureobasidium namibiae CBS 147.97]|uniref:Zn(2)-C6 fungal-type domain-containing protein n=1 Tax=Aureobasidium namibiae CBS 147.97 TaxID=1043004 RepID=A0A074WG14_9PEZI